MYDTDLSGPRPEHTLPASSPPCLPLGALDINKNQGSHGHKVATEKLGEKPEKTGNREKDRSLSGTLACSRRQGTPLLMAAAGKELLNE